MDAPEPKKDRFGIDWSKTPGSRFWKRPHLGRRMFFRHLASAVGGYFLLPTRPAETIARANVTTKGTAKNVILILMSGGPSHVDTFDLKEGSWTPSAFAPTSYGSIRWPQGLMPNLANQLDSISLVRSVKPWALVHVLARTWVMIGRNPAQSNARFAPHIGSVVSLELSGLNPNAVLPVFVSLNATNGPTAGFLSTENNPFYIFPGGGGLANTTHAAGGPRFDRRFGLATDLDAEIRNDDPLGDSVNETFTYNASARKMMYNPTVDSIFTFDSNEKIRYGNTGFGNACIAARRLLRANAGTRFVQITQGDWDHHENIYLPNSGHFAAAKTFDNGLATLISDLKSDGLLDQTLILCIGEFGRVPGKINASLGRDHYQQQAVLMAGAGIKGHNTIGATDSVGNATSDPGWARNRDIRPEDLEATIYSALGIDYTKDLADPSGRGFQYVPFSDLDQYGPINELWG
jgi:Protein of unknown function (DUF1501)